MFFFCFRYIFAVFINDNRNREKITHESCDDREFREVVGIGASTDRYKVSKNQSFREFDNSLYDNIIPLDKRRRLSRPNRTFNQYGIVSLFIQ